MSKVERGGRAYRRRRLVKKDPIVRVKIDLLPKGARRIVTRRHRWMVALLVGVLILGPGAWYWHQLRAGVARLERTKAELGQHLDRLALVSELVNSHEALTARLGTLQELLQTRDRATRFTSYLSELAALLPGGTVLSDISLDRERLAVRGYLASYAEAAALLRALAASEHFTHPRLRFLYQETGRHRFELTAQLRQGTVPK